MTTATSRCLILSILLSSVLTLLVSVPEAHADIFSFLKRHLIGGSSHHYKKRAAHRVNVAQHRKTAKAVHHVAKAPAAPKQFPLKPQPDLLSYGARPMVRIIDHDYIYMPPPMMMTPSQKLSMKAPMPVVSAAGSIPKPRHTTMPKPRHITMPKPRRASGPIPRLTAPPQTASMEVAPIIPINKTSPAVLSRAKAEQPVILKSPSSKSEIIQVQTVEPEVAQSPPQPQSQLQSQKENNDTAFSTRASWYGPGFEGRKTASGKRFDSSAMTAASRTLPMGTRVLVANPSTGKCCTVTINDRGPYVNGRDIDLSRGAAGRIGVTGVSPVVCVAFANPTDESDSADGVGGRSSRKRHRHSRRTASAPQKVSGKVMHLVAGII